MRGSPWFALIVLTAGALGSACAAAFDGTVYRGRGYAFRIPPPPSTWHRIEADGTDLVFRDTADGATVALGGRCGKDAEDVPLAALTQHLFFQFTERDLSLQEVVPLDGREAMHTVMSAKLDGVPKEFDVWVMKKDGCVYDIYFIADPGRFDAGVVEFRKVVTGFSTVTANE